MVLHARIRGNKLAPNHHVARVRSWPIARVRCGAPIWQPSEVERTCHPRGSNDAIDPKRTKTAQASVSGSRADERTWIHPSSNSVVVSAPETLAGCIIGINRDLADRPIGTRMLGLVALIRIAIACLLD